MKIIHVNSWLELQEEVFREAWSPEIGRFRSSYVFRGVSDFRSDLSTALMRLGGRYWELEAHMLRNFRKYAHKDVGNQQDDWTWVTIGQHYGLPTRLLDWTYSPYVAMHFATSTLAHIGRHGAIWCVDLDSVNEHLPKQLKKLLKEEGSLVFTDEMLGEHFPRLTQFDKLNSGDEFALFYEPPSLDQRIVSQFAVFGVMSSPQARLDHWIEEHGITAKKLILDKCIKWEIRDKLDQANINERLLFPGLDGISRWLARHYSPSSQDSPAERSRSDSHPGSLLSADFLKPLNIEAGSLAEAIGAQADQIAAVIAGEAPITAELDLRLARYLGTAEGFWMNLQMEHELGKAREVLESELESIEACGPK